MTSLGIPLAESSPPLSDAGSGQLIAAALLGIATVIVLIVWAKFHPFIALILGTAVLGAVAVVAPLDVVNSFTTGLGSTFGSVGLLIALGAMLGKLLADSGGANEIVDRIVEKVGPRTLPWAMALIAAIIGLPMFFEIGVVILVPIIILVGRRTGVSLMKIGIPALAGLSILHGLVPPHPGPVTAIDLLHANLSQTLIFGLDHRRAHAHHRRPGARGAARPGGPRLRRGHPRRHRGGPGHRAGGRRRDRGRGERLDRTGGGLRWRRGAGRRGRPRRAAAGLGTEGLRRPPFAAAVLCMVLPVAMMLAKAIGDLVTNAGQRLAQRPGLHRHPVDRAAGRRAGRDGGPGAHLGNAPRSASTSPWGPGCPESPPSC